MNKYCIIFSMLTIMSTLTSCAIEEISRQPLLTPPLGLKVKLVDTSAGGKGFGLYFTANNPEIYFVGYSIFISTRREDFDGIDSDSSFAIIPTLIENSEARLLTNFNPVNDTNMSIFIGGQMAYPQRQFYPPVPFLVVDDSDKQDPILSKTSFDGLPPRPGDPPILPLDPFVSGTPYYFGAYAYSSVDNAYSLPSNICTIVYYP